jgi:predicted phage baseplate assembly protein
VPSGTNNISVRYRKGIGVDGNLAAGQLSLLQTRPIGLTAVDNPGPATGAADPERFADIRRNAPLTVLTMDRLVSLADYEDFARAFAGIGKVKATDLWDGKRGFVHVTVADGEGQPFAERADTLLKLEKAYKKYQDPAHVVIVSPHVPRTFGVTARVLRDESFDPAELKKALLAGLVETFGFAARGFGQAVSQGEVTTALHGVKGVIAVDLDAIYRTDDGLPRPLLPAQGASWSGRDVVRDELLLLDPDRVVITWMSAAAERDA